VPPSHGIFEVLANRLEPFPAFLIEHPGHRIGPHLPTLLFRQIIARIVGRVDALSFNVNAVLPPQPAQGVVEAFHLADKSGIVQRCHVRPTEPQSAHETVILEGDNTRSAEVPPGQTLMEQPPLHADVELGPKHPGTYPSKSDEERHQASRDRANSASCRS
jgi:hypothetical protein